MRAASLLLLTAACGTSPPSGDGVTTDATDVSDLTDVVEPTDPSATDLTDAPSDPPPPDPPPATLGTGFVDVPGLDPLPPGTWVFAGDKPSESQPRDSFGHLADLDGDGLPELIVGGLRGTLAWPTAEGTRVFRYDAFAGIFTPAPDLDALLPPLTRPGGIALAVDLDGDGFTDLYQSDHDATFAWGDGQGGFLPPEPLPEPMRSLENGAMNVALADVDDDGWLDIIASPGACGPEGLDMGPLVRTGLRTYMDQTDRVPLHAKIGTWAAMAGPMGEEPLVFAALGLSCLSNSASPGFFKRSDLDSDGWPLWEPYDPTPPNSLHKWGNTGWEGYIASAQPMGGALFDLDGDQRLDLTISVAYELQLIMRGTSGELLEELSTQAAVSHPTAQDQPHPFYHTLLPWGVAPVDLDRDGRQDLVMVHGDDFGTWYEDALLPQWPTAWWNRGDGTFEEITPITGFDGPRERRSIALGDLDRDGDPDLVMGGQGAPPNVFRNEVETGHSLGLRLVGTTSNHLGVGARVRVFSDDVPDPPALIVDGVGSPMGHSEPLIFAGLGPSEAASRVEIRWPSGLVQEVTDLSAGQVHTIEEPPTLILDTVSRHQPADGASTVTLTVQPRNADGSPRSSNDVTIELAFGTGTFAGPATAEGDAWVRTLVAPEEPGSAVFQVTIDGVTVPIRPRVWWDG